jgi:hypothetical protein
MEYALTNANFFAFNILNQHGLIFTSIFAQAFFIFAHILGKHQDFAEKKKNSA